MDNPIPNIKDNPTYVCVESLKTTLQSIPYLKGKVLFVTNEESAIDQMKGVNSFPSAVVIYEGMRAVPEQGQTAKIGISGEMVFSIVVLNRDTDILQTDQTRITSIAIMDKLRSVIMGTRSPTGHFWRFMVEAPALERNGVVLWVQRWTTPYQAKPSLPPS